MSETSAKKRDWNLIARCLVAAGLITGGIVYVALTSGCDGSPGGDGSGQTDASVVPQPDFARADFAGCVGAACCPSGILCNSVCCPVDQTCQSGMCKGGSTCTPSESDISCTGASSCACDTTFVNAWCSTSPSDCAAMPSTCCSCLPGCQNCNLDLPFGICYEPFLYTNTLVNHRWVFPKGTQMVTKNQSINGQLSILIAGNYIAVDYWTCSGKFCWSLGKFFKTQATFRIKFSSDGRGLTVESYNKGHDPGQNPAPDGQGQTGVCTDC